MTSSSRQSGDQRQTATDRITIGLIPKAVKDLEELQEATGLTKTDLINRAIGLSAFVNEQQAAGKDLLVRHRDSGEVERVHLL